MSTQKGRRHEELIKAKRSREANIEDVRLTPQTRDGGKDLVYQEGGEKIYEEVKNWDQPVGAYEMGMFNETITEDGVSGKLHSKGGFTDGAFTIAEANDIDLSTAADISRADKLYARFLRAQDAVDAQVATTVKHSLVGIVKRARKRPVLTALAAGIVFLCLYRLYRRRKTTETWRETLLSLLPHRVVSRYVEQYRSVRGWYSSRHISSVVPWRAIAAVGIILAFVATPYLHRATNLRR